MVVVGAGCTGLAAAVRLQELGAQVTVLEAGSRPGGVVGTRRIGGFLVEDAANSFAAPKAPVLEFFRRVGLADRHVEASAAARHRYIVRGGALVPVPLSPLALLQTSLLSGGAKLRVAREAFVPAAPEGTEESVAQFVRRRFGQEALDYLANPFVAGVYAGDPEQLSLPQCFPPMRTLEREHGSILKGMMKSGGGGGGGAGGSHGALWSFPEGLGEIATRLAGRLDTPVRLGMPVTSLERHGSGWRLAAANGETVGADAVVWTAPAHQGGVLAQATPSLGALAARLATVQHPSVTRVALGFRREQVTHPLDGFGALVPEVERRQVLGVLFSSTLFAQRAPDGHVLLTVFVGGARQPALASLEPARLVPLVVDDLRGLLGIRGEPVMADVLAWPRAIPQYTMGYEQVRQALFEAEHAHAGLVFAGTYRDGISVGDALASGLMAADRVAANGFLDGG